MTEEQLAVVDEWLMLPRPREKPYYDEYGIDAETWDAMVAMRAEVKLLRAIVDKLPKTADDVPIVAGETYYTQYGEEWLCLQVSCYADGFAKVLLQTPDCEDTDSTDTLDVLDWLYSARKAADAAGENP